jgi:hypothetical protein
LSIFPPNASGLPCAKNLRKWAEKAFASSTLVFHGLVEYIRKFGPILWNIEVYDIFAVLHIFNCFARIPVRCSGTTGTAKSIGQKIYRVSHKSLHTPKRGCPSAIYVGHMISNWAHLNPHAQFYYRVVYKSY